MTPNRIKSPSPVAGFAFKYHDLVDDTRDHNSTRTETLDTSDYNYILYIESQGTGGHGNRNGGQKFSNDLCPGGQPKKHCFKTILGFTLVGGGGGSDKYIVLYKRTSTTTTATVKAAWGSAQALFIKTTKSLSVKEAYSIQPNDEFATCTLNKQVKRSCKVPQSSANEIIVYAEDEGAKDNGSRYRTFSTRALKYFVSNNNGAPEDDMVYLFGTAAGQDEKKGNGAYMRIGIQ